MTLELWYLSLFISGGMFIIAGNNLTKIVRNPAVYSKRSVSVSVRLWLITTTLTAVSIVAIIYLEFIA